MTYSAFGFRATSTITFRDVTSLRRFWKTLDPLSQILVGRVAVERPLTAKQRRRIPAELRAKLA